MAEVIDGVAALEGLGLLTVISNHHQRFYSVRGQARLEMSG